MGILAALKEIITPTKVDYVTLLQNGAIIVDVRSKDEFRQGHAKGSLNIPLNVLKSKVKGLIDKEVILVCRSGARAARAKSYLKSQGIIAYNAGPWQNVKKIKQ